MRKLGFALIGATALAMASAANATITVDASSMSYTGPTTLGTDTTIGYSEAGLTNPTFTEWLTLTNTLAGIYSISLSTSSAGVDFTSAVLSDGVNNYALSFVGQIGSNEFWGLGDTLINSGQYTLTVNGNNSRTGTLGGTITIAQALPEPGTWAMMLIGFGAVGFALRRKRKLALISQLA
ncbi:MAG: FxDxF family PEP-CTERM protein [Sphingomicrobium sp.]